MSAPQRLQLGREVRAVRRASDLKVKLKVGYLFNLWLKDDFDPEEDEIPEAQAFAQAMQWRTTGTWPG